MSINYQQLERDTMPFYSIMLSVCFNFNVG